ncbi:hypothetical protein SPOG_04873 [Schizosaccharomyces cryophilus OY26]|uniref:Uncharacterized protein n=1 Tax=Schizosaccharomyces cryophilus (strain OY26 / ATCC MYA-4695 / CBS 11777 / NBRC 106824 / NRRL Y48691) TaxID=653667 RepID=S9X547_SCHCR|nr:uncharacterized protein SPOG_04873 [Schizosaccharomyces cryophilus OY26]EPY52217.1 hypothetical protein SPOG_04873 [Schizosaccharomyces cryophilus OY26]
MHRIYSPIKDFLLEYEFQEIWNSLEEDIESIISSPFELTGYLKFIVKVRLNGKPVDSLTCYSLGNEIASFPVRSICLNDLLIVGLEEAGILRTAEF